VAVLQRATPPSSVPHKPLRWVRNHPLRPTSSRGC
jgi:hypothetical protein